MRLSIAVYCLIAASAATAAEPAGRATVPTCPGRGYVPYAYPAFGSCPCAEDGCFHPRPYYACCGDADPGYKKAFWRRWLRAHFHGGSMLDGVPCHCIYPAGPFVAVPTAGSMNGAPAPAPVEPSRADVEPPEPLERRQENLDAPAQEP